MKSQGKNIILFVTVLSSLFFFNCDPETNFEENNKANVTFDLSGEVTNNGPQFLVTDESNPSNKYIRIDSTLVFGFGLSYVIPDSLKESDLKILVKGKMRESAGFNGSIAITMSNQKDSTTAWEVCQSAKFVTELNKWTSFKDSVYVYKTANNLNAKVLKVFPFMNRGKGTFDVDDLTIQIIRE